MKTRLVFSVGLLLVVAGADFCAGAEVTQAPKNQPSRKQTAGVKIGISKVIKAVGDWAVNDAEVQELQGIFDRGKQAADRIIEGPQAGFQRRQVEQNIGRDLENFLSNHVNSAWVPSVRLELAGVSELRCGYFEALEHYRIVWGILKGSTDRDGNQMARQACGYLARLLALTGRISELDQLVDEVKTLKMEGPLPSVWGWAMEMRTWAKKHPTDSYKCGLHTLDQLGRLTQSGQFSSAAIVETESSENGFTISELVALGTRVGLRVHAAQLNEATDVPIPCIAHLRSEHFVVIREKRDEFYEVFDPTITAKRWLTLADLAREMTGAIIVSDAVSASVSSTPLDSTRSASYRGRCHAPVAADHQDSPCQTCCGGGGPGGGSPNKNGSREGSPSCSSCIKPRPPGMPEWFISEPFLNLWVSDTPLEYTPGYGPTVTLRLNFNERRQSGVVSGALWRGAEFGFNGAMYGWWSCSWLSFAELDSNEATADVMLPGGGWATFTFQSGSSVSDLNYLHNLKLEKVGSAGNITSLVLKYPDGSTKTYGSRDDSQYPAYRNYFLTADTDPSGSSTTYSYDSNHLLTTVTAADGTTFTLNYAHGTYATYVTSVTTSYSATVTFTYGGTDHYGVMYSDYYMVGITDAAGISSQIYYALGSFYSIHYVQELITPYGLTLFDPIGDNSDNGVFDRTWRITLPDGNQEFYGQMNSYGGMDWPAFSASQIPTNTPVGTLDTTARNERNTFYWNAVQFASYVSTPLTDFDWAAFKRSRINHWLATTDPNYTHFDTLSIRQEPSPDGGTTEGSLTWYDYAGKPSGLTYERGTQVNPSVLARVMPDGNTWHQYLQYNSLGTLTNKIERWGADASPLYRTNRYVYDSAGIDLIGSYGAGGELEAGYAYDGSHPHLPIRITNAVNDVTSLSYDTKHRLSTRTDAAGLASAYTYYGTGVGANSDRLQKVVDSLGSTAFRTNAYTWAANGTRASQTDERWTTVNFTYDDLGRLVRMVYPDGTGITNVYTLFSGETYADSTGGSDILDRTAVMDRLGFTNRFRWDSRRRLAYTVNPLGTTNSFGYCNCGDEAAWATNAFGSALQAVTSFNYDDQGRLVQVYDPEGNGKTNTIDSVGRITMSGDKMSTTTNVYDNLSRLVVRKNAGGVLSSNVYDVENRVIYATDSNGVTSTNTYDLLSRLVMRGFPDGGVERFAYSARGLIAYTNQISSVSRYSYDEALRMLSETNANAEVVQFKYDQSGNLTNLIDGKSQNTFWRYDQYGRLTNKIDNLNATIFRYAYNANGWLTNRYTPAKGTTEYRYDGAGNLTLVNYPSGTVDITLNYDALNRLTNMVDAAGTTKFTYTLNGKVATEDGPWSNDTVTYGYTNGLVVQSVTVQQPTSTYGETNSYDGAARLQTVASPAGSFTHTYKGAGSLWTNLALPNTSRIVISNDSVARVTGTWLLNSSATTLDYAGYLYDSAGERTKQTRTDGSYYDFTYDAAGQLKTAIGGTASEKRGYFYDGAWNLSRRTNNATTQTFVVNTLNQVTNDPNGKLTFDSNGNLATKDAGKYTLSYDAENQLARIEFAYSGTFWASDFVYDGRGRLRKRVDYSWNGSSWYPNGEIRYVYDGMRVVQERNSSNNPTVSYTRGIDLSGSNEGAGGIGGLLSRSSGYSTGTGGWSTHHFYHSDGNGNITMLVDGSQISQAVYRYDPFGNTISSSGSLAAANTYRFSSKEIHSNSGFYYFGFRFYDPNDQKWLNQDPIRDLGSLGFLKESQYWQRQTSSAPISFKAQSGNALEGVASLRVRHPPNDVQNAYEFSRNDPIDNEDPFGLRAGSGGYGGYGRQTARCTVICLNGASKTFTTTWWGNSVSSGYAHFCCQATAEAACLLGTGCNTVLGNLAWSSCMGIGGQPPIIAAR